jgi:hypothetical protein
MKSLHAAHACCARRSARPPRMMPSFPNADIPSGRKANATVASRAGSSDRSSSPADLSGKRIFHATTNVIGRIFFEYPPKKGTRNFRGLR